MASPTEGVNDVEPPIHLLKPSDDHRSLVLDAAAARKLAQLGPTTVLSVVGNQRGGKSTLMNLLHGRRLKGFQTGHYMDPQTYGVWVWPRPHPRKPDVTILLIDTEGLDSPHVPQHYNWLISAVTLLMSDVFLYQTRGSIEQSSADRLDTILRVADQLGKAGESGNDAGRSLFVWLLRDHQLHMQRSPKEELVEKLDPEHIRTLRRSFGDYDCVPLPRPAGDDVLRRMEEHTFQDLAAEFREEFVVLERRLFEALATPRVLFGKGFTGEMLTDVLRQYLAAISRRSGMLADICQMPTQRELIRQLAGKRAMRSGLQKYEEYLCSVGFCGDAELRLPVAPSMLLREHEAAQKAAGEAFMAEANEAGLEGEEREEFWTQLTQKLADWTLRNRLTADDGVFDSDILDAGVWKQPPGLGQSRELTGGLLLDLWQANARQAVVTKDLLLERLGQLGVRALAQNSEECAKTAVETLYKNWRSLLQDASKDSSMGPWAQGLAPGSAAFAKKSSGLPPLLLLSLSASQQGDELIEHCLSVSMERGLMSLRSEMKERCEVLQRAMAAQEEVLLEQKESFGKVVQQLDSRLTEIDSALRSAVKALELECETRLKQMDSDLRSTFKAEVQASAAEARALVDEKHQEAGSALKAAEEGLGRRIEESSEKSSRDASAALQAMDESLRKLLEDTSNSLQDSQSKSTAVLEDKLDQQLQELGGRLGDATQEQRGDLERLAARLTEVHSESKQEDCQQRESCAVLEKGIEDVRSLCESTFEGQGKDLAGLREVLQTLQEASTELETRTSKSLPTELAEAEGRLQQQFRALEASSEAAEARADKQLTDELAAVDERLRTGLAEIGDKQQQLSSAVERQGSGLELVSEKAAAALTAAQAEVAKCQSRLEAFVQERFQEVEAARRQDSSGQSKFEAYCKQAVDESSKRTLGLVRQALDVVEQEALPERLAPLEKSIRDVAADLRRMKQEVDEALESLEQKQTGNDLNAIWESFAHFAQQLAALQTSIDSMGDSTAAASPTR
eukprot:TRINITY_DN39489_c0_g1_i1.p1 TRINITY_DN39489_c0_g1~~TRINITY_DN39489_c0_g1_i1.p1  ORF type:complete len:1022 (-),score=254.65 TRINITY_DN39489_c0_g1_i1:12-3077(-)